MLFLEFCKRRQNAPQSFHTKSSAVAKGPRNAPYDQNKN